MQKIQYSPTNLKGEKWEINKHGVILNNDKYLYHEKKPGEKVELAIGCYLEKTHKERKGWYYGCHIHGSCYGYSGESSGTWEGPYKSREEAIQEGIKYLLKKLSCYFAKSKLKAIRDKLLIKQSQKTLF